MRMAIDEAYEKIRSVLDQPEVIIRTVYGELLQDVTFTDEPKVGDGTHPRLRTCRMIIEYQLDERGIPLQTR